MVRLALLLSLPWPLLHSYRPSLDQDTMPYSVMHRSLENDKISVLSMVVEYHRTAAASLSSRFINDLQYYHNLSFTELACTIRFYAVAYSSSIRMTPEEGVLAVQFKYQRMTHPLDPILCYFTTSHNRGPDFIDSPKTTAIAIYCPISLDMEIGKFNFVDKLSYGKYCLAVTQSAVNIECGGRKSVAEFIAPKKPPHFLANIVTKPFAAKRAWMREQQQLLRPHGVCLVQTFQNEYSGYMLFLSVKYYYNLGFSVIIYDRSASHRDYLASLLHLSGVYYHPFTIMQVVFPQSPNNSSPFKYYYLMEHMTDHPGTQVYWI